jgi:hypothetical protein
MWALAIMKLNHPFPVEDALSRMPPKKKKVFSNGRVKIFFLLIIELK